MFQNVWNAVVGRPVGYGVKDYDLFYFDVGDLSCEAEDAVIARADALFEDLPAAVELRNEARVHLWYEEKFGTPAVPFTSAAGAIGAFASTTCSLGVTRARDDPRLYAPFGPEDVLALDLRPNRRRAPRHVHELEAAQYRTRWPRLTVDPW